MVCCARRCRPLKRDTVQSIPLAADGDDLACIVHILPLSRAARDFAPKGTAIILISQLQKASGHQNYALLKGLYDLTKGEARVASEILTASSLPDIAKRLSLSYETVRSVAKAIYAKTGSNGQADFIHRMGFVERFADGQGSDGQSSRE